MKSWKEFCDPKVFRSQQGNPSNVILMQTTSKHMAVWVLTKRRSEDGLCVAERLSLMVTCHQCTLCTPSKYVQRLRECI